MNKMINKHGGIFVIKSDDDQIEARKEMMRMILRQHGVELNPLIEDDIGRRAKEGHDKMIAEVKAQGVPDIFKKLISASDKAEVSRLFKLAQISDEELFLLISNYEQIGLQYKSFFKEFRPEYLALNSEDIKVFADNSQEGIKSRKKAIQMFDARKHIHVHVFSKGETWYCFFFDFNDLAESSKNHWGDGRHIHFVSSHWGLSLDDVLAKFEKRQVILPKLHVRYRIDDPDTQP